MEQKPEDIVANETATNVEFKSIDCSDSMNLIDPEDYRPVESRGLCVSTTTNWTGTCTSTLTNLHTVNNYSFNRGEKSISDPMNDAHFTVEEVTARNYDNSCVAGCLSTKEVVNQWEGEKSSIEGDELMYKDLISTKDLRRVLWSCPDIKNLSSNKHNVDLSGVSAHVAEEDPSSIISSNSLLVTEGSSSSKSLECSFSSSFSKFFLGRLPKDVQHENPRGSAESLANENMQGYSTESPAHCGVTLREWLESRGANTSKNCRLLMFKQIVEIVDVAHSQGIAFLELWPSSFTLSEIGDVKYIGKLMEIELLNSTKKRCLEPNDKFHAKMCEFIKLVRPETRNATNCRSLWKAQKFSIYEGTSIGTRQLISNKALLEKEWYALPERFKIGDLVSLNIYSLGVLLFEFLCSFESMEAHSAAMLDLHYRIFPPHFLSESPKEAGFCFWLLHPQPSSRPTIREILQSELINVSNTLNPSNDEPSSIDTVVDAESDLLLHFLDSLKQQKQNKASNLMESLEFLNVDINVIESSHTSGTFSDQAESPNSSISKINVIRDKLLGNINELENAYFSVRSNAQSAEIPDVDRSDKDVLRKRERLSWAKTRHKEEKSGDCIGRLFDGICKFGRYNKLEVCGTLRNGDILHSNNVICSLSFDREEEYIAAAGVSKKIKIFELGSLLNDYVDVQYPLLEMSNKSKFSCVSWNNYIKNYLASTDYDGLVQMWDASTGQGFAQYKEHEKRAWSVDFSRVDPTKFASGSDDCSLRIWSIDQKNSMSTIWSPSNICCVQFSSSSSHLLAFGSADYKIYCYDLRHTRIPWCTLSGHENAVSYVRFLDSETIVSASTDNTLKLWDLKKTSLDGLSPNACSLTFTGHTNEKNFVGLTVLDGYIACGSETNEVYTYHRSLPMPITSHKFGHTDPIFGDEINDDNGHFVSSVCWRRKSQMLAAANSSGSIKILRMA